MTGRPLDPAPVRPRAASLSCPSCGAGIAPRAQGWAVTIACDTCGAVLDATDPNLHILQRQSGAAGARPRIPLGTRGTWHGAPWDVIGFQVVTISVEGTNYSWSEYVAFNPYRGFLYLSEYQGHWNIIEKLHRTPIEQNSSRKPTATLDGRTYTHFQTATAYTTLALGEFPWELRVGDAVIARDFVDPPYMLSAEASDGETTWSQGTYTPPDVIAKMFGLPDSMLKPIGVFSNQPNPYIASSSAIAKRMGLFLLALVVMLIANMAVSSGDVVFTNRYTFKPTLPDGMERVQGLTDRAATADSEVFVTPAFTLTGRPSSVEVEFSSDLDNNWVFYGVSLINEDNGETRELSKELSYYSGRDSDGNWSEGSTSGRVRIASVPAGRYFLRVAPEGGDVGKPDVHYTLRVRRDTPSYFFYLFALLAIVVPGVLAFAPRGAFETRRWQESDYAVETSSDDGDDE